MLQVNRDYLQHDYYTDIITFDQSEEEGKIEGDIFISVERVADNASQLAIPPNRKCVVYLHMACYTCVVTAIKPTRKLHRCD